MKSKSMIGPSRPKPKVVLVLQGGGALGAYHIGAYQALQEAGFEPDWVSGISIGAINSAILVGNEPAQRWRGWRSSGTRFPGRRAGPCRSPPLGTSWLISPAICKP
jgi:predicted acylesterase/phospholipase RssA